MLRITHHRVGYAAIGCSCRPEDWDDKFSRLKPGFPNYKRWNNRILSDFALAEQYILEMEAKGKSFTVEIV